MDETNIIEETLEGSIDSLIEALKTNMKEFDDNIYNEKDQKAYDNLLIIKEICDQLMTKLAKI